MAQKFLFQSSSIDTGCKKEGHEKENLDAKMLEEPADSQLQQPE